MNGFELKLGLITYVCSGTHSNIKDQDWSIRAKINDLTMTMHIPIESKVSRAKCMLFVERFHEALMVAQKEQEKELQFSSQLT